MTKDISIIVAASLITLTGLTGCQRTTQQDIKADKKSQANSNASPMILNIAKATKNNEAYRHARWTGSNLQMVLMTLKPGEIIDLEMHNHIDQLIRIEEGEARILAGKTKDDFTIDKEVSEGWAALIPGGYWHKVENIGERNLKIYTLYSPPEHLKETLHKTYDEAAKHHHDH
ncbi:Thermophilic glucose-6-phosphate isomerase [Salinivirga cyanobacteriivorans]|uniref:Thermophilic glucose-6-phosphate isomerase n=1 Tax=Salinivirga cyanobacteriivorans TaxID=1307839 RepID=A0A0S2HXR2_9BACT|nr:cupin domain-containing protein [Salinivirga cyanobacteriivorans]ALO14802.1 Thermophilic glucose-6-phosphate isomerase [Salinivirga cyanobacteriivorans]